MYWTCKCLAASSAFLSGVSSTLVLAMSSASCLLAVLQILQHPTKHNAMAQY